MWSKIVGFILDADLHSSYNGLILVLPEEACLVEYGIIASPCLLWIFKSMDLQ